MEYFVYLCTVIGWRERPRAPGRPRNKKRDINNYINNK